LVEVSRDHLQIAAGGGTHLALLEIQPEGRRPMPVRDFLAGHPLKAGTRLGPDPT
jgi:methionyl-tRNA formyltransferase